MTSSSYTQVIHSNKDEYLLNKCRDKTWFVIELCESIRPQKVSGDCGGIGGVVVVVSFGVVGISGPRMKGEPRSGCSVFGVVMRSGCCRKLWMIIAVNEEMEGW